MGQTNRWIDGRTEAALPFLQRLVNKTSLSSGAEKKGIGPPRWPPSDWSVDHTAWELTGSETCKKSTRNTDICSSGLAADSCSRHLQVRGIKKTKNPAGSLRPHLFIRFRLYSNTEATLCVCGCVSICFNSQITRYEIPTKNIREERKIFAFLSLLPVLVCPVESC